VTPISRRQFLSKSAMSLAAAYLSAGSSRLAADPLGLPIGLQLYTVKDELAKDFDGTLRQVGAIGYKEVEMAGFYNKKAAEVRQSLDAAGLRGTSAHYPLLELLSSLDEKIAFAKELGLKYMICSFPWIADPSRFQTGVKDQMDFARAMWSGLTLDDWKWNAEQFNKVGEQTMKAGIQFGYHNHNLEFKSFDGVIAYDELLRLTDAKLVQHQLDCGWVAAAGHDPVAYLQKYPGRFSLLHVKDPKRGFTPSLELEAAHTTEIGSGAVDWKKVFAAAKKAGVKGYFVEQEPPFEKPPLEAIKISYNYLHKLKV